MVKMAWYKNAKQIYTRSFLPLLYSKVFSLC